MTWEQFARGYLVQNGMFEDQAKAVVALAMEHELFINLVGRWNDPIEGYTPIFQAWFVITLRRITVEWIEKNFPQARFKAVFQD